VCTNAYFTPAILRRDPDDPRRESAWVQRNIAKLLFEGLENCAPEESTGFNQERRGEN